MAKKDLVATLREILTNMGFPEGELEHKFHPKRRWRFDLAWPDVKIAVERQGGTWTRGRHVRPEGYAKDCEKLNEAQLMGWIVIWVTADQIDAGDIFRFLDKAFEIRGCPR